jgi:hypothetical protein
MRKLDISKSHGESPRLYGGWSNTLQFMECSDLDRVSHVRMGVVQHSDTPDEHANMLYFDGGTKISEGTTVALYVVSDVGFLSCPCTEKQYFGVV